MKLDESILNSVKKLLGIQEEYEQFDPDIIMHVNSAFMILNQIGAGPEDGFRIEDKTAVWGDFTKNKINLESVKTDVYLRVKLMFDPPLSSIVTESINRMISEFEWRIQLVADVSDKGKN